MKNMLANPIFSKEYKSEGKVASSYILRTYFPNEDEGVIAVRNVASTKTKVYIEYPECFLEIESFSGAINAHLFSDEDEFARCIYIFAKASTYPSGCPAGKRIL